MIQGNRIEVSMRQFEFSSRSLSKLADSWQMLESHSYNVSFFTSWNWIEAILAIEYANTYVLTATKDGRVIGLAILGYQPPNLKNGFNHSLWLNKLGDPGLDQPWIEYNDFLLDGEQESTARSAMWNYLLRQSVRPWTRIHLDMMNRIALAELSVDGLTVRQKMRDKGFIKTLSEQEHSLLKTFSKNTRSQLARSRRLLQPMIADFKVRDSIVGKQACFEQIASQHRKQWRSSEWGSGFDNPAFVSFHQALFSKPQIEIAELSLKTGEKAFLYNFIYGNKVYFYLSCVPKLQDNKIKLGLVLHLMAMEHYQSLGLLYYDFLAGDARYKRSLSDVEYELESFEISRKTALNQAISNLRRIKQAMKRIILGRNVNH